MSWIDTPVVWPQTVVHAPLVGAVVPRRGNESNVGYQNRSLHWRAWAARMIDPARGEPDTWNVTEWEYKEWLRWCWDTGLISK